MKKMKRLTTVLLVSMLVIGLLFGYISSKTEASSVDTELSSDNVLRCWAE